MFVLSYNASRVTQPSNAFSTPIHCISLSRHKEKKYRFNFRTASVNQHIPEPRPAAKRLSPGPAHRPVGRTLSSLLRRLALQNVQHNISSRGRRLADASTCPSVLIPDPPIPHSVLA
ncbi:hypothetical protein E2C01_022307 [Portunus trituberculatus]|uniref:Uncharacterized protein n=1 Tax=Portunus trituberculatus TaxID=210409 RepID=A0A5B7E6P8_PORTR|nr:hypothetical protein [Portunus trituberculatus]